MRLRVDGARWWRCGCGAAVSGSVGATAAGGRRLMDGDGRTSWTDGSEDGPMDGRYGR